MLVAAEGPAGARVGLQALGAVSVWNPWTLTVLKFGSLGPFWDLNVSGC